MLLGWNSRDVIIRPKKRILYNPATQVASPPGIRLGAYEVVSLLGADGMGEVYRASDSKLNA
jgi:hypothetical protein